MVKSGCGRVTWKAPDFAKRMMFEKYLNSVCVCAFVCTVYMSLATIMILCAKSHDSFLPVSLLTCHVLFSPATRTTVLVFSSTGL